MKPLLLDTHVVIWWLAEPRRLARRTHALIERADVAVSVVSLWEIHLKQARGKLRLPPGRLSAMIESQGFTILPLRVDHVEAAADFGGLQADPSDRMIVGTAWAERKVLVTRDAQILERAAPLLGELLLEA